ncbi:hypothetical protein ACHWQZ_G007402 [Mnemiopsis leidyi]
MDSSLVHGPQSSTQDKFYMYPEEVPDFWCRSEEGGIARPGGGKRRAVSRISNSDIRVSAALANTNCVQDCRDKTLYEICLFVLVRHVNCIAWDNVCQHIAADVLHAAHSAGTIADKTVTQLIASSVHSNFITALDFSYGCSIPYHLWKDKLCAVANSLRILNLTGCLPNKSDQSWITGSLVHLTRLEWLSLCRCKLQDDAIKKLVYPTKYSNKGLTKLRYLDISENPELTVYAVSLAREFPCLQTLVSSSGDQKYFIFPDHKLVNWGHDIVYRWMIGLAVDREGCSKFYKSDKDLPDQTGLNYNSLKLPSPTMTSSSQAKPSSSRASVTSKVHLSRQLCKKSSEKENNVTLLYKTPTFNSQVQSTRKKRGIMLIGTPGCGKTNKKQKIANISRLQVEETMSIDALESKSSSVLDCYRTVDHSSDKTNYPNQSLFSQLDSGSKGFYS